MEKWFINNLWLKAISLILAIITWLYISEELAKRQSNFYLQRGRGPIERRGQ